jgi:hypothetical protein
MTAPTVPSPRPETPFGGAEYSDDGVDLTLIRWALSMTPAQRLHTLQNNVVSILKLRAALKPRA